MYKKRKVKKIFIKIKNRLFLCFSTDILFENAKSFTRYCLKMLRVLRDQVASRPDEMNCNVHKMLVLIMDHDTETTF